MVYDGKLDRLKSETRNGRTLVYDKEKMMEALNARDGLKNIAGEVRVIAVWNPHTGKYDYIETTAKGSFVELCRSRFIGFVQSRLYNGSWNQELL